MHIDYLNVSVPETISAQVIDSVQDVLDYCGAHQRTDEIYRLGETGTVRIKKRNGYALVGLSGDALSTLRKLDMHASMIWSFAVHPHRVTSLDIAHDVAISTRGVLNSLWRKARGTKGLRLSRKRVPKSGINKYVVDSLYDDGITGTVYLGSRKSEVYAKVYDKRNEIMDRTGSDIGYDLTRYELTATSKMGVSLSDVDNPEPLFWNYMSEVLPCPSGIPNWVAGGQGYTMPERRVVMPAEKLKQVVSESPEIERWLKYADDAGPNGREYLLGLLRRRILTPAKPIGSTSGAEGDDLDSELPGNMGSPPSD
jgi:hypothetical protein